MLLTLGATAQPATAHTPPAPTPRPVVPTARTDDLAKGQTAENIASGPGGTRSVGLSVAGQIEIQPRPGPARLGQMPERRPITGAVVATRTGSV